MSICLGRRKFIAALGGAAAWPLAVSAQQRPMPVVGLLQIGSSWDFTGFRQGLKETGYVEGQNLVIEYRWANDDPNRLPELAADLARRPVHVIVAFASRSSVDAAKPPYPLALLCAGCERPRRRAAEERDENATPNHSITSSAMASSVGGTSTSSLGLLSTPKWDACGSSSCRIPSCLPKSSPLMEVIPVTFPPGRLRLAT